MDFDLDEWLDAIEPPQRSQTVNTRGDLLARHAEAKKAREDELQALTALARSLPEETDGSETIGEDAFAVQRADYEAARARIDAFEIELKHIERAYAANRATFTFKALAPDKRTGLALRNPMPAVEGGSTISEQVLRLFLASVASIVIHRDGVQTIAEVEKWSPGFLLKFFAKIGEGQSALLWDAYIGLGMASADVPQSPTV